MHNKHRTLEPLEQRHMLAAYVPESLVDYFNLPLQLYDVAPPGGSPQNFAGAAIGLGDINADGFGDFAISAFGTTDLTGATEEAGAVYLYSGATGHGLRTLHDGFADFGFALANVGDINDDGVPDLLVGSPRFDGTNNSTVDPEGAAYIYSGADGTRLRMYIGSRAGSGFGRAVALAGDANGDSIPDVIVGAPTDGPAQEGRAYVLSGDDVAANQQVLFTFTGEASGDAFGTSVAPADLQTTGIDPSPDYLIGAPGNDAQGDRAGRAYLYRQSDGAVALTLSGEAAGEEFGTAVLSLRTSAAPLVVGAPGAVSTDGLQIGGAVRYFRADGSAGHSVDGTPGSRMGTTLAAIGDMSGDGFIDLAVSSPGDNENVRVRYYNGVTGQQSYSIGERAFGAGDINGDGRPDVVTLFPRARAVVLSAFDLFPPDRISGGSSDLTFLYFNKPYNIPGPVSQVDYAVIDGAFTPYSRIPGMRPGDAILGVNNAGLIAGAEVDQSSGTYVPGSGFLILDGVRTILMDAVTQVVGDVTPNFDSMLAGIVGNDGSVLLKDASGAWVLKGGVLTFLWAGRTSGVNSSGTIIGTRATPTGDETVMREADGQITVIAGPRDAVINDAGAVAGVDDHQMLVTWHNGVLSTVASMLDAVSPSDSFGTWTFNARDNDDTGKILVYARQHTSVWGSYNDYGLLFTPGIGFEVVAGGYAQVDEIIFNIRINEPRYIADNGAIVNDIRVQRPLPAVDVWTLGENARVASTETTTGAVVFGTNVAGDLFVSGMVNGEWQAARIGAASALSGNVHELVAYTDPRDGQAYVFARTVRGIFWAAADPTTGGTLVQLTDTTEFSRPITSMAVMITGDRRVVLAIAYDDYPSLGRVAMYYQTGLHDPSSLDNWVFDDITTNHIEAGGQAYIPVSGEITAFSTRWGALNIVYLNSGGSVQAVWWAPGMTLWRTDNLSASAGAPAINGPLRAFTTSWDAMNIIGTDDNSRPVAVWWVPGASGWMYDGQLTAESDTAALDPASLVVYTTPWNAMNIVGRDAATGRTIAYWWVPGMTDWRVDELIIPSRPEGVITTGQLAGGMAGNNQTIFGREASTSHLVELFWMPGQTDWDVADITERVA